MSSLKMTFSLTSLILIFALAFVAMPAMAADGGPTVSITEYTGKNAADPAVDHVQMRTDFRLKVAFSHLVTDFDATDVTVQTAASTTSLLATVSGATVTLLGTTGAAGVPATELTANKVFVIGFTLDDSDFEAGYLTVSIGADLATGAEAAVQNIGNQAGSFSTSSLPKANDWTITASIGTDKPEITGGKLDGGTAGTPGTDTFDVNFTFSGGTGAIPDIPANQIQVKDAAKGTDIAATVIAAPTNPLSATGVVATGSFTVVAEANVDPVLIGVNPNWANAAPAGGLRIPAAGAPPTDTVDPTVDIALVGTIDESAKTFEVKFTFAKADVTGMANKEAGPVPTALMANEITLQKENPADATMMVDSDAYVRDADIIPVRAGVFLATVNYRLDALPVYVGLADGVKVSATTIGGMTPAADAPKSLKVEMAQPTVVVPSAPTGVTATADPATNMITVSWTVPDTVGSGITGYTIEQTGAATATLTAGATDTSVTTPALGVGTYMFTVMATNSDGDGPASASASAEILTAAPAAPNNILATAGVEKVTLTWDVVSGNTYEYRRVGTTTWMPATSPQEVMGLTANVPVSFEVRVAASGNVPAGTPGTSNTVPPLAGTNAAPEVDAFGVYSSNASSVTFLIRFTEPMSKDTDSISRLQPEDFRITDHGENPIITGVTVSSAMATTIPATTTGGTAYMEEYYLTVPLSGISDARPLVADRQLQVYAELDPGRVGDEYGKEVEQPPGRTHLLMATYDMIPPAVESHTSRAVTNPTGLPPGDYVEFTFVFDEPISTSSFSPDSVDQGSSHNVGRISASHFNLMKVTGSSDDDYTLLVPILDAGDDTIVVLKVGANALEDMYANGLEVRYIATHSATGNTAPVFIRPHANAWTWCEAERKRDEDGNQVAILLPKARDEEGDGLTYALLDASGNPALPTAPVSSGLYWITIDTETRHLLGAAKTTDAGTYTWQVTDEHGATDTTTLTLTVTPYAVPMPVTNVMAMKVDGTAIDGADVDKVKLMWTDPNPTTYPNPDGGCIPEVTSYIITRQELNSHSQGRTPKGAPVSMTRTVAQVTTAEGLVYTTARLPHGTYEFTITAVNAGGNSNASGKAVWDRTNYHWVIVDDPLKWNPVFSANLRANQTEQPAHSVTLDWNLPIENSDAPVDDAADAMALYGVATTFGGYHLEVTNQATGNITNYPENGL